MNDKALLRAEEVARLLGIGRSKAYELIAAGDIPSLRIGRLVRVPRHALDRWIAERTEWRAAG
jgi:excisionase family DNA binding protein